MRPEIDLTDAEREAVESYAEHEGFTMKHAYAQLIRDALYHRVSVDFDWGDAGEFAVKSEGENWSVFSPISERVDREGEYVISTENREHIKELARREAAEVDGDD